MCTFSTVLCAPRGSSVKRAARLVKIAVTACAALIVTVQVPVPEQPPPLQPEKVEPAAGAAVKVTELPLAHVAEPAAPPRTKATGARGAAPLPAPAFRTLSVT